MHHHETSCYRRCGCFKKRTFHHPLARKNFYLSTKARALLLEKWRYNREKAHFALYPIQCYTRMQMCKYHTAFQSQHLAPITHRMASSSTSSATTPMRG